MPQYLSLEGFGKFFVHAFLLGITRHLLLIAQVALIVGILFFDVGSAYGIPYLFWHEIWWKQFLAGMAVGLLMLKILFVGYLLDTRRPERRWPRMVPATQKSDPALDVTQFIFQGFLCFLLVSFAAVMVSVAIDDLFYAPSFTNRGCWYHIHSFLALPPGIVIGFGLGTCAVYVLSKIIRRETDVSDTESKRGGEKIHETIQAGSPILRLLTTAADLCWNLFLEFLRKFAPTIEDPTEGRLHDTSLFFTFVLFLSFASVTIFALAWPQGSERLLFTPATVLCVLMGLAAAVYGALAFRLPTLLSQNYWTTVLSNGTFIVLALVLLMLLGGRSTAKLQFNSLDPYYANPVNLSLYTDPAPDHPDPNLLGPEQIQWTLHPGQKRKMVIVCTSGGALRAATWTGAVLGQLENHLPGFSYRVRIITGASGGMLGGAYYAMSLTSPDSPAQDNFHHVVPSFDQYSPQDSMVWDLGQDSLSETIKWAIYVDLPAIICPGTIRNNRGYALEHAWMRSLGSNFRDQSLADFKSDEQAGWRPSLVFAPMMVEDGRRLLISNLDLSFLTVARGYEVSDSSRSFAYSRDAYQMAVLFPTAWPTFPIRTAVRMSASFPYVSPAVTLPTLQRHRVVDAGYFDNYGVTIGAGYVYELLMHHKPWLDKNVSGIVLIQIRDGVNPLEGDPPHDFPSNPGAFSRGMEWLLAPIDGFFSARASVSLFRNDAVLDRLSELFDIKGYPKNFFTTALFDYDGDASMSWYMTRDEIQTVIRGASILASDNSPSASPPANQLTFDALRKWWNDEGKGE
jgi:hypothetical protein